MEYLFGKPAEILKNYLILETKFGEGIKIWTLESDDYSKKQIYKIFIFKALKIENQSINVKIYGFLNKNDAILFSFLNQIKGIGPKTSMQILSRSSSLILKLIKEENLLQLMSFPEIYKYSHQIIDFFKKPKNKLEIEKIFLDESTINLRKRRQEILEIAKSMNLDISTIEKTLKKIKNLESISVEEAMEKILQFKK